MGEIDTKRAVTDRKSRIHASRGEEAFKKLGFFHIRDLEEDQEPLFEALVDFLVDCLHGADRFLDIKLNLPSLAQAAEEIYELERNEVLPTRGEGLESQ